MNNNGTPDKVMASTSREDVGYWGGMPRHQSVVTCSLCPDRSPYVDIVMCARFGDYPNKVKMCMSCHLRVHGGCADYTWWTPDNYACQLCCRGTVTLICRLCVKARVIKPYDIPSFEEDADAMDGVAMCQACSDEVHDGFKGHHSDHFYLVASSKVIPPAQGPAC